MAGSSGAVATGGKSEEAGATRSAKASEPSAGPARETRRGGRERRQLRTDRGDLGEAGGVADERLHAGILQPVAQRIDAEQARQRQRDGAELVDRDVDRGD